MTPLAKQRLFAFDEIFPAKIPVCARKGRAIIAAGELGIVRIGVRVFVPESELERFLSERFTPARESRKVEPPSIELILDSVAPRKRKPGRPRVKAVA